ncbi:hypothetical protein BDY24DRAFT_401340 [Mrakia frigida]|uniref:uncharacterized protein n=1 Tax=Mrakia frigida TaxID=29902 RepID=UPI003FCC26B3
MAKSAKVTIQSAAEKSDSWLESNETEITRLHALHTATQDAVLKATVEAYNKYYAERKASFAKIPSFWFSTFMKHPQLSLFLAADADQEALTYLEDVSVVRGGDKKTLDEFDLVFTFKENPFFSETTLTKSYTAAPQDHSGHNHAEGEGHGDDEVELIGTVVPITWKDASRNLVKASPRNVGDEDEESLEPGSFFCLFTEAQDPFNLGEVLRDEVVPNALELFAGMAELSDDEDMSDSEDDEEEELDPRPTKRSKA